MSNWLSDFDRGWDSEWFGACVGKVFGYAFPIRFEWKTDCIEDGAMFAGYGPEGVATLLLDWDVGFRVKHTWITDVIPRANGTEQRVSRNDAAKQRYIGASTLFGDDPRAIRAKLARYAALGSAFLIGLQHEALTLSADSNDRTVFVNATALAKVDWNKIGQRVVVAKRGGGFINAVIQDGGTANSIVLNIAPGALGKAGCAIMPTMPVYFDPKQVMARYRTKVERWQLDAHAAMTDFAPTLASLPLGPITTSASLDNVVVTSRLPGLTGNTIQYSQNPDAFAPDEGSLFELDGNVNFIYKTGVTTIGDLAAALTASSYIKLTGTWSASATLADDDQFAATFLTGGGDTGDVGTGAVLTMYDGLPVWDRKLKNEGTLADSMQSGAVVIDHGGAPYAQQTMDKPDWGRAVELEASGPDMLGEQQWFKKFTATVRGRQGSWWLPTWRDDFTFVSKAANVITVSTTDGSDVLGWWPLHREHIQIIEDNGTITRAKITAVVDNGNSTATLTIGTTLVTNSVKQISWLELCRFESDEFEPEYKAGGFRLSTSAHVISVADDITTGDDFLDDEMSAENSQPREYMDIVHGTTTYRIAFGTRDMEVGSNVYPALPAARGEVGVASSSSRKEMTLTLPSNHALVRRYCQMGNPPKKIMATLYRKQLRSGLSRVWFSGQISALEFSNDGTEATFTIPERAGEVLLRVLPTTTADRRCQNTLYDSRCKVDRTSVLFKLTTTVLYVNGRTVRYDQGNTAADGWAINGELVHVASGEPATVLSHGYVGLPSSIVEIELQMPIPGMQVGDTIEVYAGCDLSLAQCIARFANKDNFRGMPQLPQGNPHLPEGVGP